MTENNVSRSLGLLIVQTTKCLTYTSAITQTAADLGIQVRAFKFSYCISAHFVWIVACA